jgi:hypothetical protein
MPSVSIPIIDQLVHPNLGLLTRVAVPGNPFNAFTALSPPQNPLVALTYGICFKTHTIPPEWGHRGTFPVQYEDGFCTVVSHYQDLSGLDVIQQLEVMSFDAQMYFWQEPLPLLVSIDIQPGWALDLFYMQT